MEDFDKAIKELECFLQYQYLHCKCANWNYYETDNAPESYKELQKRTVNKVIPIANYGCDTAIYRHHINIMFRFYHDVTHLELNKDFSDDGEYAVIDKHMLDLEAYGVSALAKNIFLYDTRGQVAYYSKHKEFVQDQTAFVKSCLEVGLMETIKTKH